MILPSPSSHSPAGCLLSLGRRCEVQHCTTFLCRDLSLFPGSCLRTLSFKGHCDTFPFPWGGRMVTSHLRGSFPSSPHLRDLGCSSEQPPPWQEATELLPCLDSQCASHCRADPAVCVCTCTWLLITPECLPQLPLEKCRSSGYSSNRD